MLVISQDVFNERSGTVIALPLTGREPRARFPLTLESHATGLPRRSWVKIAQAQTLSTQRIGSLIGRAPPEELVRVLEGLNEIIGR